MKGENGYCGEMGIMKKERYLFKFLQSLQHQLNPPHILTVQPTETEVNTFGFISRACFYEGGYVEVKMVVRMNQKLEFTLQKHP